MKRHFLLLVALLFPLVLAAQSPTPTPAPASGGLPTWKASLPGGEYEVAIRSMISVSMHEYIVDGAARVTEVNIGTPGNLLPRFYYLEPLTPQAPLGLGQSTVEKVQELVQEGAQRTGQDAVLQAVVKNYPTSTHAHTVEYRLSSKGDLQKLFNSAEKAFRLQRSTSVKISGTSN